MDSQYLESLYHYIENDMKNIETVTICLRLLSILDDKQKVKCLFTSTSINWFILLTKIAVINRGNNDIENNILTVIYGLLLSIYIYIYLDDWNMTCDYLRDKTVIELICYNIMNKTDKYMIISIKSLSIILSNDVTKCIDIISYPGLLIHLYNLQDCKEGHSLLTILLQIILTNKKDTEPEALYIILLYY